MSHTYLLVLLLGVLVVLTAPSLADFPKHPPEHESLDHPRHPPVLENVEDFYTPPTPPKGGKPPHPHKPHKKGKPPHPHKPHKGGKPPHHPGHPPVEQTEDAHRPPVGKPPKGPGHPSVENEVGVTAAKKPPSPIKKPPHKPPSSN